MMSEHENKFHPDGMSLPRLQLRSALIACVTREICFNQWKQYPDLGGSDTAISMVLKHLFLSGHLAGKPVIVLRIVGCILDLVGIQNPGFVSSGLLTEWATGQSERR